MPRIISSLFAPLFLLTLAFFMAPRAAMLPPDQFLVIKLLPLGIMAPMLFLCWRFNRSRLFFSTLVIALSYLILVWVLPDRPLAQERSLYQLVCLLAPLNLLIFSELEERGIFTGWGLTRFMIILLPATLGWALIFYQAEWLNSFFNYRFMPRDITNWTPFSQPAQTMALIAILIMNGRLFSQANIQRGALFGCLAGLLIVLHYPDNQYISSIFTSAIVLMLVATLVEESWSMAYIDHLTGLPGRRALNDQLLKLSGTYSIAMMDIDHFKKFNDTYGHDAGDEVLRMVASRMHKVGSGGKVFRYGGEEFSVVFNGKPVEAVIDSLEEIRELIAESGFKPKRKERRQTTGSKQQAEPKEVQVTISIGVAERSDNHPEPNEVIKAADKALYQAKKKGRNQVCK